MKNLLNFDFTSPNGIVEKKKDGSQCLIVKRSPIGEKFIMDNPLYTFAINSPIELEEYVVIEYDCFGINRPGSRFKGPFMTLKKGEEDVFLFRFDDMTIDRKSHSIVVKAPEGKIFEAINMEFFFDKVPEA